MGSTRVVQAGQAFNSLNGIRLPVGSLHGGRHRLSTPLMGFWVRRFAAVLGVRGTFNSLNGILSNNVIIGGNVGITFNSLNGIPENQLHSGLKNAYAFNSLNGILRELRRPRSIQVRFQLP